MIQEHLFIAAVVSVVTSIVCMHVFGRIREHVEEYIAQEHRKIDDNVLRVLQKRGGIVSEGVAMLLTEYDRDTVEASLDRCCKNKYVSIELIYDRDGHVVCHGFMITEQGKERIK